MMPGEFSEGEDTAPMPPLAEEQIRKTYPRRAADDLSDYQPKHDSLLSREDLKTLLIIYGGAGLISVLGGFFGNLIASLL